MTREVQQLMLLEAEVSKTGNEWQKHPNVPDPEALCILGTGYLRRGNFKGSKGYWWGSGITTVETKQIKQLSTLSSLSEGPSVVGLLRFKEQQVLMATMTAHWRQYHANQDSDFNP